MFIRRSGAHGRELVDRALGLVGVQVEQGVDACSTVAELGQRASRQGEGEEGGAASCDVHVCELHNWAVVLIDGRCTLAIDLSVLDRVAAVEVVKVQLKLHHVKAARAQARLVNPDADRDRVRGGQGCTPGHGAGVAVADTEGEARGWWRWWGLIPAVDGGWWW